MSCEGGIACRLSEEPRSVTECQGSCDPYEHEEIIKNEINDIVNDNTRPDEENSTSQKIIETEVFLKENSQIDDPSNVDGDKSNAILTPDDENAEEPVKDIQIPINNEGENITVLLADEDIEENITNIVNKSDSVPEVENENTTMIQSVEVSSEVELESYNEIYPNTLPKTNVKTKNLSTTIELDEDETNETDENLNSYLKDSNRNEQTTSLPMNLNISSTIQSISIASTNNGVTSISSKNSNSGFSEVVTEGKQELRPNVIDTGIVLEYDFMVPAQREPDTDTPDVSASDMTMEEVDEITANISSLAQNSTATGINNEIENKIEKSNRDSISTGSTVDTGTFSFVVPETDIAPTETDVPILSNLTTSKVQLNELNSTENNRSEPEYDYNRNGLEYEYDSLDEDEYEYDDFTNIENEPTTALPRPQGIVEDKINVEDFEIVELIQNPIRENRKQRKNRRNGRRNKSRRRNRKNRKNKRKLVVHEGEDAISMLNEIFNENIKRREEIIRNVNSVTIVPFYSWNVGDWTNVSIQI